MKSIGEVSKMTGISVRTLQYYDDIELLSAKRNHLNYRLYDDQQIQQLWQIYLLKAIGMDLETIKAYLDSLNNKYLIQQKQILETSLQQLQTQLALINKMMQDSNIQKCPLKSFDCAILEIIEKL